MFQCAHEKFFVPFYRYFHAHKYEMWRVFISTEFWTSTAFVCARLFLYINAFLCECVCLGTKVKRKIKTREEKLFFCSAIHQFLL